METVRMFVNGQAMSGGTLHHALAEAKLIGKATTAANYRFYSVRDEFPGLYPVEEGGVGIPGEIYEVDYATLREKLLPNEPIELELTVIKLEDGSASLSMKMREASLASSGVVDISGCGGWSTYLSQKGS